MTEGTGNKLLSGGISGFDAEMIISALMCMRYDIVQIAWIQCIRFKAPWME